MLIVFCFVEESVDDVVEGIVRALLAVVESTPGAFLDLDGGDFVAVVGHSRWFES